MPGHDDVRSHFNGALKDRVEVVNLEPKQHAVAVRPGCTVADRTVIVVRFEAVQLQNKLAVPDQTLIDPTPMVAPATEHALVPTAAGFHIGYGDERLGTHHEYQRNNAGSAGFAAMTGDLTQPARERAFRRLCICVKTAIPASFPAVALVEVHVPQDYPNAGDPMGDPIEERGSGRQPALSFLTSHLLSVVGSSLVTMAGCAWCLLMTLRISTGASNPYVGILIFMAIPAVFFVGLALIPLGAYLARRRIAAGLAAAPDRRVVLRRLAVFLGVMTVVNVIIGSQVTYRAIASRHRADGKQSVLRANLPRHEASVRHQSDQPAPQRGLRGLPCSPRRGRIHGGEDEWYAPDDLRAEGHLREAHTPCARGRQAGLFRGNLRAMPRAGV